LADPENLEAIEKGSFNWQIQTFIEEQEPWDDISETFDENESII